MNKPTQITLANSLPVSHSSDNGVAQQLPVFSEQTLSAKNIVFAKGSVQMEVYVDKHWQTLRLATTGTETNTQKIASADIQLSNDGKQLTILPKQTEISLRQINQLQSVLNFINSGVQVENKPLSLQIILQPTAKLLLNQLQASIPINKEVAQLLHSEQGLKAIITPNRNNFTLSVVNRFANTLHQQPISQAKLALWLSKLVPNGQLQQDKNTAILSFNNYNGNIKLALQQPLNNHCTHSTLPAGVIQKVQLNALNEQLIIKTQLPKMALQLKNSLAHTFNSLLQKSHVPSQFNTQTSAAPSSPSLVTSSPISSWLQDSFADLKTRISDAVRYFESKPFSQLAMLSNKSAVAQSLTPTNQTLLPKSLRQINLVAMATNNTQPLLADISQGTALPKNYHQSPPLVQLFQRLKASLASITDPNAVKNNSPAAAPLIKDTDNHKQLNKLATAIQSSKTNGTTVNASDNSAVAKTVIADAQQKLKTTPVIIAGVDTKIASLTAQLNNDNLKASTHLHIATQLKEPITSPLPASQISLPLEAKLLASLLKTPSEKPLPNFKSTANYDKQYIASQIDKLAATKVSENVDLNRLVNQAFSRMIDSQSLQPLTIQREILSILRPESLTTSALQNSFSQSIEHLAVAILAAPSLANSNALNFNSQSSLDALLQVLMPNFKATNPQKLQEQLLQPQSQALAAELSQIKTAISQINSTPINQQPDNNPLVQFLLPMRLPPETAQTEISLGQYKKPSKNKLEDKNVWFVRLNFDYAELGQLQITAELMDKALDCQLLASSQDITAMTHPHLESLRHKLTAHGLQVGEMQLSQGAPQHHAFYQSHAIINIKV
ncbi:flagellar hook-length control protein FliK [Pseudoalteromonas arctica]|uniref:Flagellar hook-length control protein FliK n=1 Tax=Pseudoalteromonas arctica TaxID=394751 RepID=A0A7Y0DRH8_9GAMM|nr:flagellar hook-length control protein FliK [Pseudoalteromonas arctica]NMM40211.1 flagellar hook-length control protein FliK [Pseudoalteromonas arctica]